MLLSLRIENFALVDYLELEFGVGLNVLTGETGAGKSIILDAIDAVLGGKVSSRVLRTGAERAIVEGTFSYNSAMSAWLTEQEIDALDESVVICREITATSSKIRSRSRINGVVVNRQVMSMLRDRLVEITAQGQTVQVGQSAQVRNWLDVYGGDSLWKSRQAVSEAYSSYQSAHQALEGHRTSERDRLQQLDWLNYQIQELADANLTQPDEMDKLLQEQERLNHVVELQQASYKIYQALYQNDGGGQTATDLLGESETTLMDMVEYDTQELQPLLELVRDALSGVSEVARIINAYGEALEADPQRLEEVSERIQVLKQICRKYGPTLAEAIAHYQTIEAQLAELNASEESIEKLVAWEKECLDKLHQYCRQLTHLRQAAGEKLQAQIVRELKPLAMEKVQFQVEVAPISPTAAGADKITFLFSPNPGEPLQPLSQTASGGEMSRFLLALKTCISQADAAGTMVFDEIDVGVSGKVAQAIADKLHQLSWSMQVLCVTHQPLVAAMADRHFRVEKHVINEINGNKGNNGHAEQRTVVRVKTLDSINLRRDELAQLAGGKSAQDAVAFADSLLVQAANHRQENSKCKILLPSSSLDTVIMNREGAKDTKKKNEVDS